MRPPGVALALLLGVLACSACKPADPAPELEPETFEPLLASPGHRVSTDGRIKVPVPSEPGWECLEERHGEAEAGVVALRCRRSDPREFMFFAAKTNRQPVDQRTDAQTLLMSLYRADNEAFFDRVEYLRDGPAELVGTQAWESELEGEVERLGVIRKRERVAILGGRIYAISAEGTPELWAAHDDVLEQWFARVEFAR